MRDTRLGREAPHGGRRYTSACDRHSRDPQRQRASYAGREHAGEADRDEHNTAGGAPGELFEDRGDGHWHCARGGHSTESLWRKRVEAISRSPILTKV